MLQRHENGDSNPTENRTGRRCFVDMMEENEISLAIQQVKILHLTLSSHTRKELNCYQIEMRALTWETTSQCR